MSHFRRIVFVLLAFGLLLPSPPLAQAHSPPPCSLLLLSSEQTQLAFESAFRQELQASPRLERLYLRLRKNRVYKLALAKCQKQNSCTADDLAHAVRSLVAQQRIPSAAGYAYLLGGMVANAALSAKILTAVSKDVEFVPIFVSAFLGQASLISANFLAPFLEPLSNRIRQKMYARARNGSGSDFHSLDAQADRINSTYTLREQHASDRILSFRTALRFNLQMAAQANQRGDQDTVIAELADAAMAGFRHFRDLSPSDATIVSAVHTAFLRHVLDPSLLLEPSLELIRKRDPDFSSAETYYREALRAWLTPSPAMGLDSNEMTPRR